MAKKSVSRKKNLRPFENSTAEKRENKSAYKRSFDSSYDYSKAVIDNSNIGHPSSFYLLSTNTHYDTYKTRAEKVINNLSKRIVETESTITEEVSKAIQQENDMIAIFATQRQDLNRESFLNEINLLNSQSNNLLVEFNQQVLEDIIKYSIIKKVEELIKTETKNKIKKDYQSLISNLNTIETPEIEKKAKEYQELLRDIKYSQLNDIKAILNGSYKTIGPTMKVLHTLVKFKAGFFNEPLVGLQFNKNLKDILGDVEVNMEDVSSAANNPEVLDNVGQAFIQAMKALQGTTADMAQEVEIKGKGLKFNVPTKVKVYIDAKLSRDGSYKTGRKVEKSSKLSDIFSSRSDIDKNNRIREDLSKAGHSVIFKALASAVLINNNKNIRGGAIYSDILNGYFEIIQRLVLESEQKDYTKQVVSNFVRGTGSEKGNRLNLISINNKVYYYSSLLEAIRDNIKEGKLTLNMYGYLTRLLRREEAEKIHKYKVLIADSSIKKGNNQSIANKIWKRIEADGFISHQFEMIERNSQSMKVSIKLKAMHLK